MKLSLLDKSALILMFVTGGLYGLTDVYASKDAGTFLGSAMVVMLLSIAFGWIVNKILTISARYKRKVEILRLKINPAIALGVICSVVILVSGVVEFYSY